MDRSLLDLTDKVAVITGGSRGIGKAIAFAYAEHGADVVIASRKLDNCQAVADEITEKTGRRTLAVGTHVGRWDECNALADTVLETHDGKVVGINSFLDTERLFPLFGLPPHLD